MQSIPSLISCRRVLCNGFLLALLLVPSARATNTSVAPNASPEADAFSRYIACVHERDPLGKATPSLVFIRASLPDLYKDAEIFAIRGQGDNRMSLYQVLYGAGDGTVAGEVMERYFELEKKVAELPLSSILITPANYKFHYRGTVNASGHNSFIYSIVPRKNRFGLIKGQLWIDGATGAEVLVSGRLSGADGTIDVVRETDLNNGAITTTHINWTLPLLGRGELDITETPLRFASSSEEPMPLPREGAALRRPVE